MATNPHRIIRSPKDQDARLYEAAPDLLAALKEARTQAHIGPPLRKIIDAALDKAEGK